jgi:hypothetical protein
VRQSRTKTRLCGILVARQTINRPPLPNAAASAAAHCRLPRSSNTGDTIVYFFFINSIISFFLSMFLTVSLVQYYVMLLLSNA